MTLDQRRLIEALGVLVGDRGNGSRRAVRLDELQQLVLPANAETRAQIAAVNERVTLTNLTVDGVAVTVAALNQTADDLIAQVNAFATSIQTDFDALIVDVDAANAAALQAAGARDAAEAARDAALSSANDAGNSATQSASSSADAETARANAVSAASTAAASSTDAGNSAAAAASSASTASTSASDAQTSATAATASQVAAETARAGAESAQTSAATSETNAAGSAAQASTSANNAATSATGAGASATAAQSSASLASTSASDAETSATAALAERILAETASSSAGVSRDQAVSARDSANDAAALAGDRLEVTAAITSQGISVLRDQFLAQLDADYWTRDNGQGTLTILGNTIYSIGSDWRFEVLSGQIDGMLTRSDRPNWRGPRNAERYLIEVDFTLESGDIAGACIYFDWVNTAGTVRRVEAPFSAFSIGPVVMGQPMTASMLIERPASFSGTFSYNRLIVYANRNTALSGNAAKTIRFHRASVRTATDAESRLVDAEASITQESVARANADAALATQITTVSADLDGLGASVSTQATAISTLEGNAAATLAFRVQSGSGGATLELIAADDPEGTTSIARIDATNIILNGSVTGSLLAFDQGLFNGLRANQAWIDSAMIELGTITSANIGTAEIQTANIQNGSVTNRFAAYTDGSVSITNNWQTIQEMSIDTDGFPVAVTFTGQINGASSIQFRLVFDGIEQRLFMGSSGMFITNSPNSVSVTASGFFNSSPSVNVSGFAPSGGGTVFSSGTVFVSGPIDVQGSGFISGGVPAFYAQSITFNCLIFPNQGSGRTLRVQARRLGGLAGSPAISGRYLQSNEVKR